MRGHIRKRGNNWAFVIELGIDPQSGKRRQKWHAVKGTKKDAERELRATLMRLEAGAYIEPNRRTLGQYLDDWLQGYAAVNTAPRTHERYREIVQKHLAPALGRIPLAKLQPDHIQAYYSEALQAGRRDGKGGLSAQTVHHHHRLLYEALRHAVRHNVLARNPAESVDPPRPAYREMRTADADGIAKLLQAAANTPYHALFYTAVYTGLRRSELLALKWQNVDLELATISVTETLHQLKNGDYVVKEPKSQRGRRSVALSPSLAILLREHKAEQAATRTYLGLKWGDGHLVFSHPDGDPIRPDNVTRIFTRLARAVGLPGLRFHDLRHTHASLMLQQGIHPKIVSERLGHSSIAITLDRYSHVLPGLQEAAARRFEEGLAVAPERPTADVMG